MSQSSPSSAASLTSGIGTVSGLAPIVAPSLARSPAVSPILALHGPESTVAFGAAGERSAARLRGDVGRVAAELPELGEGDPREILCVASDRYHFAVALLAAWQRGYRVALPPNVQTDLLHELSRDPSIALVLHDSTELSGLDLRPLLSGPQQEPPGRESQDMLSLAPLAAGRRLVTVWTSGSTGEHQRHAKTAGQLFAEALTLAEHFGLARAEDGGEERGARVVATVPSHHIYGLLFSVLVPLVSGGAFLRETPLHAGVVRAALERFDAEVLVSVPAHLRALKILDHGQLASVRRLFSSGAPLPTKTARMLIERFGLATTEVLGSTETGGIASRRVDELDELEENALASHPWQPLPHVSVSVQGGGRAGPLWVDSPFLPPNGPRPWPTSDRVELVDEVDQVSQAFLHLGRVDGVVKIAGKRIALAEIERRLLGIPGVEDAAVSVIDVEGARGRETVALVVAPGLSPEHLRAQLRRWLDPVVIPRRLRMADRLPRQPNGKLSRADLLAALALPNPPRVGLRWQQLDELCRPLVAQFTVYVPRDLFALRGHFHGAPILAGVVELELARQRAQGYWPDLGQLGKVVRLKFSSPVSAGESLLLRLERKAETVTVRFELTRAQQRVASGTLVFTN